MALYLPFLISILLILPFAITAQTYKNITLGSSLTAGDTSPPWVSLSKDFAFGFQEIQPGSFLLAIWFDKIPEKTVVWSANRDSLAPSGSKVELTKGGSLVLSDPNGQQLWRPKLLFGAPAYAALLDTGNLVLSTKASDVIWQSFDEPTDTLLPSQTLNQGNQLIARYSERNYSSGRFSFILETSGDLALYTTDFPLFKSLNSKYQSYEDQGSGFQVVFNESGLLYLKAENGSILSNMFSENQVLENVLYQRVILEHDGVLRQYIYPRNSSPTTDWSVKLSSPDNICISALQQTGSGVCGFNSYCQLGNDSKPHCLCPPRYSLLDPNNEMGGCNQNFAPQSCQDPPQKNNTFDLEVLQDVDWPFSDYEHFPNVSIDWCRQVCLDDCFCAVVIFKEGGDCWKKRLPLSNGKSDISVDRTAFIKVGSLGTNGDVVVNKHRISNGVMIVLLGTSGATNIILLSIIMLGILFFLHHKTHMHRPHGTNRSGASGTYNVRSFSYKELEAATNGFREELGRGAYSVVYKGVIGETFIAVKIMDKRLSRDADKEFKTEVNVIGQSHHKNLVRLVGLCDEGQHRMLVYEFMSNGTLSDYISGTSKPLWEKRVRLIQGVARGLCYLHEDCNSQIIHCDIKPQNILLDEDHNARISDFGLAKLLRLDQSNTNTIARGTRGYIAPEWFRNMAVTAKVDVYSFGILLIEVICCRRSVQARSNAEDGVVLLIDWASDCCKMNTIKDLVSDDLEALADMPKLQQMVKIAIWCTQVDPNLRPTMKMVVQMLEGIVEVPEPPISTSCYSGSFAASSLNRKPQGLSVSYISAVSE